MIIENAVIQFKEKHGGGIDPVTGFPIVPEESWGEEICCQAVANGSSFHGRAQGERFASASWVILIEERRLPESEQIRLTWMDGTVEGEFSLLGRPERLKAVGEIRIMI